MNSIESSRISSNRGEKQVGNSRLNRTGRLRALKRNSGERVKELQKLKRDTKVDISDKVKDFARIKRAVDLAPEIDKSEQIASLKQRISNGTYKLDYDAIADKMLAQEF